MARHFDIQEQADAKAMAGEKIEADRGYRGESKCITPYDHAFFDAGHKKRAGTLRARHETANKRFKQWAILKNTFRHEVSKHGPVFKAVAVITQLAIQYDNEPLFSVKYYTRDY